MFQLGHPIFKLPLAFALLIFVLLLSSVTKHLEKTVNLTGKMVSKVNALAIATDYVAHIHEARKLKYKDISKFSPELAQIPSNKRNNILVLSKETSPGQLKEIIAKAKQFKSYPYKDKLITKILDKISSTELVEIKDQKTQATLKRKFRLTSIPLYIVVNAKPISNTSIELNTIEKSSIKVEDRDFISKDKLNRFLIFLGILIISNTFYFCWVKFFSEQQSDKDENKLLKKVIGMIVLSLVVSYFNIHLVNVLANLKGWAFIGNAFAQGIGLYSAFFKV